MSLVPGAARSVVQRDRRAEAEEATSAAHSVSQDRTWAARADVCAEANRRAQVRRRV